MTFYIQGKSGRLGSRLTEAFVARGDQQGSLSDPLNYVVFAHRYRGNGGMDAEFDAQVILPHLMVGSLIPADGDRSIVFVSSVVADSPTPEASISYVTCKAALNGMSRYLSLSSPYRCNTVSPGAFTGKNPEVSIDDVVDRILYLCSPECKFTGKDIKF